MIQDRENVSQILVLTQKSHSGLPEWWFHLVYGCSSSPVGSGLAFATVSSPGSSQDAGQGPRNWLVGFYGDPSGVSLLAETLPHVPGMACVLPPLAASLFCVCLLGEHELSAGPWEGRTPGFPQAGC